MHLIIIGNVAVGLKVEVGKTQTRQVSFTWINWPDAKSYIAPPIKKPRSNKGKFPMYFKREWKHAEVWPLCLLCRMSSTGQGTFWLTVRVWSIWLNLPINSDIKTLSHDLKIPYHLLTEPLTPKNRGKKKERNDIRGRYCFDAYWLGQGICFTSYGTQYMYTFSPSCS